MPQLLSPPTAMHDAVQILRATARTQCSQIKIFFNSYLKNDEAYHLKKKNDLVQNARRMEIAKVPSGGPRQHTHAPTAASTLDKRS